MVRCVISGCDSDSLTNKTISFHRLPKNELRPQWDQFLARTICPKMRTKPPKICTLHFTEESVYYNKKTQTVSLKAAAVPSIYYKENRATVVDVEEAPVTSIARPTGSLCRICLNVGDHLMAPIFEVNDLHSMIHIVTDVKMVQNDGFPSMICTGCVEKVLAAYKLRVQTKQTDEILRDILKVTQTSEDSEPEASRDEGIVVDNEQNGELADAVIPKTEPTDVETSAPTIEIKEEVIENTASSILEPCVVNVASVELVVEVKSDPNDYENIPLVTTIKQELSDIVEQIKDSSVPKTKTKNRKYKPDQRPLLAKEQHADRISCHICGKTHLRNGHHLSQHIKQRHSSQTFPCDECPKVYVSKHRLRIHKRFQHELKISYKCDQCQRTYQNRKSLQFHKLELHYDGPLKYKCNICERKFRHPDAAEYHVKMHKYKQTPEKSAVKAGALNSKKPKCTACKIMNFESAHQFRLHVQTHDKNYQCDECTKVFVTDLKLRVHKKLTHSKETVGCELCEFRTKYPQTLKRHMKKHEK